MEGAILREAADKFGLPVANLAKWWAGVTSGAPRGLTTRLSRFRFLPVPSRPVCGAGGGGNGSVDVDVAQLLPFEMSQI